MTGGDDSLNDRNDRGSGVPSTRRRSFLDEVVYATRAIQFFLFTPASLATVDYFIACTRLCRTTECYAEKNSCPLFGLFLLAEVL